MRRTWQVPAAAKPIFRRTTKAEPGTVAAITTERDAGRSFIVALLLGEHVYLPDGEGRVTPGSGDADTHAVLAVGHGLSGSAPYLLVRNSRGRVGGKRDRPELAPMLEHLRDSDVVVVTRLDRLARSTRDLLDIAERLREAGGGLRSIAEPWADTTSPAGRMVLTVFAGIAGIRALAHRRTNLLREEGRSGARGASG